MAIDLDKLEKQIEEHLRCCDDFDCPETLHWTFTPSDLLELIGELREAKQKLGGAITDLAECYRQSGADPDGNEDWRLAPDAVQEVKRLRQECDEADDQLAETEAELREAREALRLAAIDYETESCAAYNGKEGGDHEPSHDEASIKQITDAWLARAAGGKDGQDGA